jgi:cytochrome d ubiquinol oxidase subunit I
MAFVITTAFVILGVGAYYLRQGRFEAESRIMVRMSLGFLAIMVPLQIVAGDLHGINTMEHQPAKLAAMEGLWDTGPRAPASLIGIPDQQAEKNHYELAIPGLASIYLGHSRDAVIKGLKEFPREDRPPVAIVYFAFRLMVGIGIVMLLTVYSGLWLWKRGTLFESPRYLRLCTWVAPIGFLAVLAGWTTTEVGRQPWVIYGLMRTADAVTPTLTSTDVMLSLAGYVLAYLVIFGSGYILLRRVVRMGPQLEEAPSHLEPQAMARRPLYAATEHENEHALPPEAEQGRRQP